MTKELTTAFHSLYEQYLTLDQRVRRSKVQRISHCWAPDTRARVTGRWVDYRRGLVCTVAVAYAPVARQAFWWWLSNHETVREWLREQRLPSPFGSCTCGAPTAIHLFAYFASCNLPNINTVKLYFYTPAPVLPYVVKFGADSCRCVPMRSINAAISHTARPLRLHVSRWQKGF